MNASTSHRLPWLESFLVLMFLTLFSLAKAGITEVYVYNTEFSINLPGGPIEHPVISQGDTIKWVWIQGSHTSTSVVGSSEVWDVLIDSGNLEYSHVFNDIGVYWYYCIPHGTDEGDGTASGMAGTITVLGAGNGACCVADGTCFDTEEADCISLNGMFQGVGTSCSTVNCSSTSPLMASHDNTIYEDATGSLSNALGSYLFCGTTNQGDIRRTAIQFDLAEIPSNAIIVDASLNIYCNSASNSSPQIQISKLTMPWIEGTSIAGGNQSSGGAASINDITWLHSNYNTVFWDTPGGDYAAFSASAVVNSADVYIQWTSSTLIEDIQSWLEGTVPNYGWLLIGDEMNAGNVSRFNSRNADNNQPFLQISYIIPSTGACCNPDGICFIATETECNASNGTYHGDNSLCSNQYCPVILTPFIDPLPLPGVLSPLSGIAGSTAYYEVEMNEVLQNLHSDLPDTKVWGYNGLFPGPTIEAFRGDTVKVIWKNELKYIENGQYRTDHELFVDTCLHGPDVSGSTPLAIVHLHGGKVAPHSDGNPDEAFPPGEESPVYIYPNDQQAATLWYHDHGLGITRLNVMMGLAGFYILRDSIEQSLNLPSGEFEIPLAIQDRSFNADGSLYYPEKWSDHFFGNTILVNGKVWPYHYVKKGSYRFRLLNGSNSRTYTFHFSNAMDFHVIGTDLGIKSSPVVVNELTLTPGERAEIIVDFSNETAGAEIILENSAPAPHPGFPGVGVITNVMKFIVDDEVGFNYVIPSALTNIDSIPESEAVIERSFDLIRMAPNSCGNHPDGMWTINGLMWHDITEFPELGTTEIWTWKNQSGMTHPMHMHLVMFQVLNRQALDNEGNPTGPILPPNPEEEGWKDTVNSPPGYQTRVIATFSGYTGLYPYHCHILEHEDHEMMRQFQVVKHGCVDESACNFDSMATIDDTSCYYNCDACLVDELEDGLVSSIEMLGLLSEFGCGPPSNCQRDYNKDLYVNSSDLLFLLGVYGSYCDKTY